MSIDPQHLREYVIRPACQALGLYSLAAEELLLGTACQESQCGRWLHQLGRGPALGPWQMEPATHDDIWANFLKHKPELVKKVATLTVGAVSGEMTWNLKYAAAMCRLHYFRVREALPVAGNLNGQAHYWKTYYNTLAGKGTAQEYVKNWNRFVANTVKVK